MEVSPSGINKTPVLVSIPQARLIELVAIFCIIFLAKEIAGFNYQTGPVMLIFGLSVILNLAVPGISHLLVLRNNDGVSGHFWDWLTVLLDLATVLALVYLTGTVESPFTFLVIVPLFFAGRLLPALTAGAVVTFTTLAALATRPTTSSIVPRPSTVAVMSSRASSSALASQ